MAGLARLATTFVDGAAGGTMAMVIGGAGGVFVFGRRLACVLRSKR